MKIGIIGASIDLNSPCIEKLVSELGVWIAQKGHIMVYLQNTTGMGKTIQHDVEQAGGKTLRLACDSVDDMLEVVDAFILLPGGIDVFYNGIHLLNLCEERVFTKPIFLLSIDDFWSPLNRMIERMKNENYIEEMPNNVYFCDSINNLAWID